MSDKERAQRNAKKGKEEYGAGTHMPDDAIQERLQRSKLGTCACTDVRRVARKLTSLYDAAMAPAEITITQYSLLANIGRAGQLSHTVLADKLGMDRTTLTRNLRPLIKAQWVAVTSGEDRRQHLLRLTAAGKKKLRRSIPLWEEIQGWFMVEIGARPLQELRNLLRLAESAIAADSTTKPTRRFQGN
jgi:DNA-binding MarR family transcriptional regulator